METLEAGMLEAGQGPPISAAGVDDAVSEFLTRDFKVKDGCWGLRVACGMQSTTRPLAARAQRPGASSTEPVSSAHELGAVHRRARRVTAMCVRLVAQLRSSYPFPNATCGTGGAVRQAPPPRLADVPLCECVWSV